MGARSASDFDFWLGEWDCDIGEGKRATNTIVRILGGKVIHERFVSDELVGESHSVFSEKQQVWLQTWVDDQGAYLPFVGGREGDEMILVGRLPDGTPSGMRMRWHGITPEGFVWDYERQVDGAWRSAWHIAYRRR